LPAEANLSLRAAKAGPPHPAFANATAGKAGTGATNYTVRRSVSALSKF